MVHGVIYILSLKTATACTQIGTPNKRPCPWWQRYIAETMSREGVCYLTAMIASTWATIALCHVFLLYWPWVHVISIQTFTVLLQAKFQMFQNFWGDWVEWIIKSVRWYFLPGKGYRGGRNLFWRGCYYWYTAHSVLPALTSQHGILACDWLLITFQSTNWC